MMNTVARLDELTVNETIRRFPATVEVFNRHGIDACCGGASLIADAAARDGADVERVLAELRQLIERGA
jgi:regulator of cell morphogenesis and NO signaling